MEFPIFLLASTQLLTLVPVLWSLELSSQAKRDPGLSITQDGNRRVLTPEEGSDLRRARMAERWKSGAPIDITPFKDDPALGVDPKRYIRCLASTRRRPTN